MRIALPVLAAALAAAAMPAAAQSEADLMKKFQNQATHRGLSLAPVTSTATTTAGGASNTTSTTVTATPAPAPAAPKPATPVATAAPAQSPVETVRYERVPEGSEVNITIQFDLNSASLRPSEFGKLQTLCNVIQQVDGVFHVFGHTDSSGSDRYNLNLSRQRAESVRRHMVENCAIAPNRLRAIGVGEAYPLVTSNPRAPENRRVEFQVVG